MNERLYIDNELMDVAPDNDITLSIASNLFTDLSKIAGNTTYTIKLPKTIQNRKVFGYADRMDERTGYAYRTHTARFFREGVELISAGRASLLTATEDGYEIVIVWGVSQQLAEIVDKGWTLQDLTSTAVVDFAEQNDLTPAATFAAQGYGYVAFATTDNEIDESEWRSDYHIVYDGKQRGNDDTGGGTDKRGAGRTFVSWQTRHPSASVPWILNQIQALTGVTFSWTGDAATLINGLVIPAVTKDSNYLTYQNDDALTAVITSLPFNFARTLEATFAVGSDTVVFGTIAPGTSLQRVTVQVAATVHFHLAVTITQSKANVFHLAGYYMFKTTSFAVVVIHTDGSEDTYYIGSQNFYSIPDNDVTTENFVEYIEGSGDLELSVGDMVCLRATSVISAPPYMISLGDLVPMPTPDHISGGFVINVKDGNEVPYGAKFPIVANLPKIKILDFVKFLSVITGTFAKQASGNVVEFVAFDDAGDIQNAYDWTGRVIANTERNIPASVAYKVGDWAQVNRYVWKEDEKTKGNFDGAIMINDDTLDGERDVMEFPFAASDGGSIPLYKYEYEQDEDTGVYTQTESFSKTEPRILQTYQVTRVSSGVSTNYLFTSFDLDMANIIAGKYGLLLSLLRNCKCIEETLRMSNAELVEFDETRPVWLGQYGAYFMVTELRAGANGTATAKMVKLNLNLE